MAAATGRADDDTLHLPRILCLHGGGTNATIFRAQCRAVVRALEPSFRLCFADAPFPSEAGPDVLSVYSEYGPFRAWLLSTRHNQLEEAVEASLESAMAEDDRKGATGDWVGLLGFSQGAKICASLLYLQQQHQHQQHQSNPECMASAPRSPLASKCHFRFAVLLAGRGPLLSRALEGERGSGRGEPLLSLPAIHVHGLADPGLALHRQLLDKYCDLSTSRLVEWDGEHRVPLKTKDVQVVVDEILCMARGMGILA